MHKSASHASLIPGTRVRVTCPYAFTTKTAKPRTGIVVGYSRDGRNYRIHLDDNSPKTVYTYHPDFVEKLSEPAATARS